jgi:undecaprenyl pyrophosphate phosphatase UppP
LVAAFISGLAAIRLLLRILSGGKLWSFALYRIVFALILLGTALTRGDI